MNNQFDDFMHTSGSTLLSVEPINNQDYDLETSNLQENTIEPAIQSVVDYDQIGCFDNGIGVCMKDGQYGYISSSGRELLPPVYEGASSLSDNVGYIQQYGQIYEIELINVEPIFNEEAETLSDLVLILTNQSFNLEKVDITVFIDGQELINQACETLDQHKGYYYYFNIVGAHTLRIELGNGYEIEKVLIINDESTRWVLISNWGNLDKSQVTVDIMDEQFLWK